VHIGRSIGRQSSLSIVKSEKIDLQVEFTSGRQSYSRSDPLASHQGFGFRENSLHRIEDSRTCLPELRLGKRVGFTKRIYSLGDGIDPKPLIRSQPVSALVLAVPLLICSHEYRRQFHKTGRLAISATGMAMMPILKNSHAVITTFSRRRAMSQRIVPSEPVTERLGPRSTPIRIACATTLVSCTCRIAEPLIRPTGKLFIPFERNACHESCCSFGNPGSTLRSPRSPVSRQCFYDDKESSHEWQD
jgi:hypothetical protein